MAEAGALVAVDARLVWAAVPKRAGHRGELLDRRRLEAVPERDDAGDAAHQPPTSVTGSTSSGFMCRYAVVRRFWSMSR